MAMYNCSRCDDLVDGDYHPPEQDPDSEFGLVCPSCADEIRCPECGEVATWIDKLDGNHTSNCCDAFAD